MPLLSTTSTFNTRTASPSKLPIYVLQIAGLSTVYTSYDLVKAGITGTLPTYKPWLNVPQGAPQSVDVLNGSASIGTLTCEVVDGDGSIRTLIGGTTLAGRQMTLRVGYPVSAWPTDFVPVHTYVIAETTPKDDYTAGIFKGLDPQQQLKITLFNNPYNGEPLSDLNPWVLMGSLGEIVQCLVLFGAGLPVSLLNIDALQELDSYAEGFGCVQRPFEFRIAAAFEILSFLNEQICKLTGAYPYVDNLGRIAIKSPRPPAAGFAPTFTFTADNMCDVPKVTRMPIVNQLIVDYDKDDIDGATSGSYLREYFANQATSISLYQFGQQQWTVSSDGLRTRWGAAAFLAGVSDRIFRRFAGVVTGGASLRGGACLYSFDSLLMTLPVWTGDYVYLTHPTVWDMSSGAQGVTNRIMEVTNRKPNFAKGLMSYELLDTGLSSIAPAKLIGSGTGNDFTIGSSLLF